MSKVRMGVGIENQHPLVGVPPCKLFIWQNHVVLPLGRKRGHVHDIRALMNKHQSLTLFRRSKKDVTTVQFLHVRERGLCPQSLTGGYRPHPLSVVQIQSLWTVVCYIRYKTHNVQDFQKCYWGRKQNSISYRPHCIVIVNFEKTNFSSWVFHISAYSCKVCKHSREQISRSSPVFISWRRKECPQPELWISNDIVTPR